MTMWKDMHWDDEYKNRLGRDVYSFLEKEQPIIEYLSDYTAVRGMSKNGKQLTDNSMYVLHICKFFEGALILFAQKSGWLQKFNPNGAQSIRNFFRANRAQIENEIDAVVQDTNERQDVKDKLFSIVQDFKERHEVLHSGSMLSVDEVQNYDAILTKVRDLVALGLKYNLLSNE